MRLLHFDAKEGLRLVNFPNSNTRPPYAILSHTWGRDGDEVTFDDINERIGEITNSAAQSKLATVEDVYERTRSIGLEDSVADNEGHVFTIGFNGEPFLFCIHSDMPTSLDNAKACRKGVDEINAKHGW